MKAKTLRKVARMGEARFMEMVAEGHFTLSRGRKLRRVRRVVRPLALGREMSVLLPLLA